MAKVDPNFLLAAMHGAADKINGLYVRQNKKTGKVYLIRYRKKKKKSSKLQTALRTRFGEVSKCSTAFVKAGREAVESGEVTPLANAYLKVVTAFNEQTESAFLRSYVMKYHAKVSETGEVSIVVDDFTFTR
jgi:hypothetical protein